MDDATAILDGLADDALYERDFYAWTLRQAALLKAGDVTALDTENLAEEIESMGKSLRRELVSRLALIMLHLLKWQYQPGLRGASWESSIQVQRMDVADHLNENPSLRAHLGDAVTAAYRRALVKAVAATGLAETTFPGSCPWSADELLDETFLSSDRP